MEKTELMAQIKEEVISLTSSPLCQERIKNGVFPVIGEGDHNASIMFIGEAPGRNEAATGRPFCGAAGRILNELLESAGIERSSVYITNIVKDRPPENRDPLPEEIEEYAPFLDRQIAIIQPTILATLGRFSMEYVMSRYGLAEKLAPISSLHGKVFKGVAPHGPVQVIPLYHPAVVIYGASKKDTLKEDFCVLKKLADIR
ncbi:MAG: uracil-DNA glycosylase [bacterium]|nr:uracil-DNA glycosylase [bacterium]